MSALSKELDRYLAIRRNLGYKLDTTGRILRRFVAFAEQQGEHYISTDLFFRWQKAFGHAKKGTWSARLGVVRLFAQWLHGINSRHEIPPRSLIPCRLRRSQPYIYSQDEIRRLIKAARNLPCVNGIRGLTYSTLFGLIAVTGLRISEAIALDVCDVDLENGVLTVRFGKNKSQRLLPVSDSTRDHLICYAKERDRLLAAHPTSFFIAETGRRPTDCAVRYNFAVASRSIGLRSEQRFHRHGRGPRIHDLRHTFAVHTLLDWYRTNKDPAKEMIKLTTYLGHTNPANTYWYLEAIPELLQLASKKASKSLRKERRI